MTLSGARDKVSFFKASHMHLHADDPGIAEGHFHHYYELMYYIGGHLTVIIEDMPYSVEGGDIVLVEARRMHAHAYPPGGTSERIALAFNMSFLRGAIGEVQDSMAVFSGFRTPNRVLHFKGDLRAKVEGVLNDLVKEYENPDEDSENMCRLLLGQLLLLIKRYAHVSTGSTPQEESPTLAAVLQIVSYIMSHLEEDLSLTALADKFCFSRGYLSRIFKRHTGFTVIEYVHNVRAAEAAKLLRDYRMSVTETAGLVGFDNVSHFGRVFRKVMGVPPRKYRAFR